MFNDIRYWQGGDLYDGLGPSTEALAQATNGGGGMQRATATGSPAATAPATDSAGLARASEVARRGNPIVAFFIALGLFIAVWYGVTKLEGEEGKRTIPFTATNMFLVTVQAALGIFVLKNVFTKWPVPGWSTVTQTI